MLQIDLAAVPSQRLAANLNGQPCAIEIRHNGGPIDGTLYLSLWHNDVPIILGRLARVNNLAVLGSRYRPFKGDLMFVDMQGEQDPRYTGLGTRWQLVYLSESELP